MHDPVSSVQAANNSSPFLMTSAEEVMNNPIYLRSESYLAPMDVIEAMDTNAYPVPHYEDIEEPDDWANAEWFYDRYGSLVHVLGKENIAYIGGSPDLQQSHPLNEDYFQLLQIESSSDTNFPSDFQLQWGDLGTSHLFVHRDILTKMKEGNSLILRNDSTDSSEIEWVCLFG